MDLQTSYLGLTLKNPLVPSASPLSEDLGNIKKMEDHGASALVMYSLFQEDIIKESKEIDHFLDYGSNSFGEALNYFPDFEDYNIGPDKYLELIRKAKESVNIPIIGSLNGTTVGGWIDYAKKIEQAGASALELNIYYIVTNPSMTSENVEKLYTDIVKEVCKTVTIPVAVKIGSSFSSIPNMCIKLADAGAKGIVMFNRFYQPDIDIDKLEVIPGLKLSRSYDMRLPLRWTAILYDQIPIDFAITSGIHTYNDVIKGIMAGASVTMLASLLLSDGISKISTLLMEVEQWMSEFEYESLKQMKGSMSQMNVADASAFERANYMKALKTW